MNVDPLAGIDAALPGPEAADEKDVFDITTLRYNLQHVDTIRSVMNIASGCVAGICGLTGWEGLGTLCYYVITFGGRYLSCRAVLLLHVCNNVLMVSFENKKDDVCQLCSLFYYIINSPFSHAIIILVCIIPFKQK